MMAIGGVIAWMWLPELQDPPTAADISDNDLRGPKRISKKLEALAVGWKAKKEKEALWFHNEMGWKTEVRTDIPQPPNPTQDSWG
jgi:hypothetical protein